MEKIKIKGIDEEIYHTVSNKGLDIYVWKNIYAKSFYLSLNVKFGSVHTEFLVQGKKHTVPNGIAHFMEHIKFNVDKDKTANDLFDPLGSDINAFTTFKFTSYLVYGTNKFSDNLNNLLDYVYTPYFTKEIIKKEKGIINSEINMVKDQPYNNLYFEFNKCLYHKEKFRNLITGEAQDIRNITLEDIKLIYEIFYHPENMFLIVTGNVNPYEIEKIVNENLEKKDIPKYLAPEIVRTKEPKGVNCRYKEIEANVEVYKAKIGLKLDMKQFKNIDKLKLNIILNLVLANNFGETSDLKEELLEEGLITYIGGNRYVEDDYVVIDITLESKLIDQAVEKIVEALDNLVMSEEDLKRKINANIGTIVTSYESCEEVNSMLQNYLIYYEDVVANLKEVYQSITIEEVEEVISKINTKEMCIVKMKRKA